MSLILALVVHASAQDFGYVAIMQQAREALVAKDYKTAKTLLTAAEAAAPTSASPLGEADLANLWFYRGLIEWRSGDKDKAALDAWRRVLIVAPQFEPDATLLPETDAQDVLYALRGEVRNYDQFPTGVPEDSGDALIFIDGKRLATDDMLTAGRHLVQVRCADGNFAGSWYDYGTAPSDYLVICTGGSYGAKVAVDPKAAKAAEKAKADAEKKAAAEKAAAEKAAAEKALAEAKAAEKKAAADKVAAEKKATADKAEAEKKAAAEKAEAEKKAAAEKAAADKAAIATTKPDDKAAAEKAAAEKAAAEKKAAADKAEAEKKAAAEKAAVATAKPDDKATAEKAAAAKKAAEKAAAEKAAAEKATANVSGTGSQATITPKSKGADIPAIALMTVGGGLIAGGLAMNYTVVEPAYAAISEANAHPGTMSADVATAWEGRFDVGRYSTIGMVGGGAALLGVGVVLQVIDVPVAVLPNGIVVSGRW